MTTLRIDPEFQSLIPPLSGDELAQLEASIVAEGCRDAIVVWDNTIIDGHNRYAICTQHGIRFNTVERHFDSREDVIVWMVQNQLGRRNITTYQRGVLALRMKDAIAAKAKVNQLSGLKQFEDDTVVQNSGKRTDDTLAEAANISHDTIHKIHHVERFAPESVKAAARSGDISTHRAYQLTQALAGAAEPIQHAAEKFHITEPDTIAELIQLHKRDPELSHIISMSGHIGDTPVTASPLVVREAADTHFKNRRLATIEARRQEAAQTPPPTGTYRTIVIDPPWPVQKIEREVRPNQTRELDYPTMTLDEIAALPVPKLADERGCHLYIWATHKFLPMAIELADHWGFRYQCLMTWVKPSGMTPYSWMYNTEHVVFARMGDLPLLKNGIKLSFEAPTHGHSIKPAIFHNTVEKASPAPRLEMFAREQMPGFTVWGNEVSHAS